jgi:hypothetical protein
MKTGDNHIEQPQSSNPKKDENRRASRKPYVRPSVAHQNLEHAVRGQTGPLFDGGSGRAGKSQGGP